MDGSGKNKSVKDHKTWKKTKGSGSGKNKSVKDHNPHGKKTKGTGSGKNKSIKDHNPHQKETKENGSVIDVCFSFSFCWYCYSFL